MTTSSTAPPSEDPTGPDGGQPDATTEPAAPPVEDHSPEQEPETPNREAAKYRVRLREAEASNQTLAGQVEALRRREVERLAGDRLAVPGDLFALAGADLAELVDPDGFIDSAKVEAAIEAALAARPGLARVRTPTDFGAGRRGGQAGGGGSTSWAQVIGRDRSSR